MNNCLVLGSANCLFKDIEKALTLGEFQGVVVVNDATIYWKGEVTAAASLHSDQFPIWLRTREQKKWPMPGRVFGHAVHGRVTLLETKLVTDYVPHMYPDQKDSGSSGLFGVKVAIDELGFDRVVCCGIPMTAEARHLNNERPWGGAANHRRGWLQAKGHISNQVRSVSGWTMELLGKPSVKWLEGL